MPCNYAYLKGKIHDIDYNPVLFTEVIFDETGEDVVLHVMRAIRLSPKELFPEVPFRKPYPTMAVEAFNLNGESIWKEDISFSSDGQVPFSIPINDESGQSQLVKVVRD